MRVGEIRSERTTLEDVVLAVTSAGATAPTEGAGRDRGRGRPSSCDGRGRGWPLALLCVLPLVVAIFLRVSHVAPRPGEGPAFLSAVLANGALFPAAALGIVLPLFLPVAVAVIAGDSIAGEASGGTLRYLLVRPVGRTRLLAPSSRRSWCSCSSPSRCVAATAYVIGTRMFGSSPVLTSLSGTPITARRPGQAHRPRRRLRGLVDGRRWPRWRCCCPTLTDSSLGAALGALAVLVLSQVLVTLDAADSVRPYLPTRYWLSWVDLFRDPILWHDVERGVLVQGAYIVVLLGVAWAHFVTKDVTS